MKYYFLTICVNLKKKQVNIRYHKKEFQHKKKVIGLLSKNISDKIIDWEKDLIKYYIKIRTFFRIKYLNKMLKENKINNGLRRNLCKFVEHTTYQKRKV